MQIGAGPKKKGHLVPLEDLDRQRERERKFVPLVVGQPWVFSLYEHLQATVSNVPFGWTRCLSEKGLKLDERIF
jgi:hypothetical protein